MDSSAFVLAQPKASKGLRRSIHRYNGGPASHSLLGIVVLATMVLMAFTPEAGAQAIIAQAGISLGTSVGLMQFIREILRGFCIKRAIKYEQAVEIKMMFARLWLAKIEAQGLSKYEDESLDWLTGNDTSYKKFMDALLVWKKNYRADTSYVRHQVNKAADTKVQLVLDELVSEFVTSRR